MIACQQTTRRSAPRADRRAYTTAALAILLLGTSCKAQKILCTTAHGGFSVRYTLVSGTGDCAMLKGGVVGVESYDRGGLNMAPGFKKQPIALKASEVGELADQYSQSIPSKMLSANGEFTDDHPGADNFCHVPTLSPVNMDLPMVPAMTDMMTGKVTPMLPPLKVGYQWSNVAFYVTPTLIGTQFTADLTYTRDACTATYKVIGLYPSIPCQATRTVVGCDGKSTDEPIEAPNETACCANANPAAGRSTGSGINPDVESVCEPGVWLCLPKAATPPSLGSGMPPALCLTSGPPPGPDAGPEPGPMTCPDGGMDDGGGATGDGASSEDGAAGDSAAATDGASSGG